MGKIAVKNSAEKQAIFHQKSGHDRAGFLSDFSDDFSWCFSLFRSTIIAEVGAFVKGVLKKCGNGCFCKQLFTR